MFILTSVCQIASLSIPALFMTMSKCLYVSTHSLKASENQDFEYQFLSVCFVIPSNWSFCEMSVFTNIALFGPNSRLICSKADLPFFSLTSAIVTPYKINVYKSLDDDFNIQCRKYRFRVIKNKLIVGHFPP